MPSFEERRPSSKGRWLLWRALASLASGLYTHRREPILWLAVILVLEVILLALLWGPLAP